MCKCVNDAGLQDSHEGKEKYKCELWEAKKENGWSGLELDASMWTYF